MNYLVLVLGLLLLLVALSAVAPWLKLPYPVLLVLGGGLVALVPGLPPLELEPDLIFLIFLPPLLYTEAYELSWQEFKDNVRPISLLAVGLVLITTVGVAALAHYVIPGFSWALGFVLGAIVSPPDALAATSATKGLGLPRRVLAILDGEGLVNDASALVAYRYAVAAVVSGTFALAEAGGQFVLSAVGAVGLGVAVGWVAGRVQHWLQDATIITALTVVLPFGVYLGAEHLGLSGVLAVVTLGLMLSRRTHEIYNNETRLLKHGFWNVVSFLLNGLVFMIIGLQVRSVLAHLEPGEFWPLLGYGLLVSAVTIVIRIGWVFPTAWLAWGAARKQGRLPAQAAFNWRELIVVSWAGVRGVISLATALALPILLRDGTVFPQRNVISFIALTVIFVTLILQGLTLPGLVRRLGVQEDTNARAAEAQELRLALTNEALTYLENCIHAVPGGSPAAGLLTMREVMQRQAARLRETYAANQATDLPAPSTADQQAAERFEELLRCRLDVTEHQRRLLVHLHRRGAYSEDAIRQVELELDRFEIALDTQLATMQQAPPPAA